MNLWMIIRILVGAFFVVVGADKAAQPYQNFLYVVQSYHLFPSVAAEGVARTVPWVELLLGVFLLTGLWLRRALQALMVLQTGFLIVLGQALIRHLPLDDCGCFGELIRVPVQVTFLFDCVMLTVSGLLLKNLTKTSAVSLDRYYGSS